MVWDSLEQIYNMARDITNGPDQTVMVWDKSLTWPGTFMNGPDQTVMVRDKSLTWPGPNCNGPGQIFNMAQDIY